MDNLIPNDDEFWDIDVGSRSRPPQRPRLLDDFDYDDNDAEKVYFVPFRYLILIQMGKWVLDACGKWVCCCSGV